MRRILFALLVLLLSAGASWATLCAKCSRLIYTADTRNCVECGRDTSSGAFKLCRACSEKLGECEHCRAKLAAAKTDERKAEAFDTQKNGTYTSGKWQYVYEIAAKGSRSERRSGELTFDRKPIVGAKVYDRIDTPWGRMQYYGDTKKGYNWGWLMKQTYDQPIDDKQGRLLASPDDVAKRQKIMLENLDKFEFYLQYYGKQDKPFYRMTLTTSDVRKDIGDPFFLFINIDKDQAKKIVDWLAESGELARCYAISHGRKAALRAPADGYRMELYASDWLFYDDLGWDLDMLKKLDGLRAKLDGAAAEKMDLLLGRLSGLRKQWEAAGKKE